MRCHILLAAVVAMAATVAVQAMPVSDSNLVERGHHGHHSRHSHHSNKSKGKGKHSDDDEDDEDNEDDGEKYVGRKMRAQKVTYYTGQQLNNPACGGPNPTRNSMVAAVKQGGEFGCGDQIRISHGNRAITITVVDFCPGCTDTGVDLTPGAFAKLASLKTGIIRNAELELL